MTWDYDPREKQPKRHKYGARKVERDGLSFDSKAEAARYSELRWLETTGVIRDLEMQPVYELIPAHVHPVTGQRVRRAVYRADFRYVDIERDCLIVEDVKGYDTKLSAFKRKLVEWRYGIEIVLVR